MVEEIGLFDENIFMYYEDTDISRRMYMKHRVCFVPYVIAKHVGERAAHKSKKMFWIMTNLLFITLINMAGHSIVNVKKSIDMY